MLAGPWARFWARLIDVYLMTYILALAIGYLSALYVPSLYIRFAAMPDLAWHLIVLLFAFVVLAMIMSLTGTTVGKAIIGIKIENVSGLSSWPFYLLRELKVWVFGFCLGLPLLNFLFFAKQAGKIAKTGSAGYDRNFAIVRRRSSGLQYGLGVYIAVVIVGAGTYWNIVERAEVAKAQGVRVWVNPATGKQTRFAENWAVEELKAEIGKLYYFNSDGLFVQAVLGYEPLDETGVDPLVYGEALQEAIASEIVVESEWKTATVDGYAAATAAGIHSKIADTHVEVTVVVMGRSAWRVLLFVRGRRLEEFRAKNIIIRSLLSTAKDINASTDLPCDGENCLSQLSVKTWDARS
jgi:hypothetical protein